MKTLFIALFLLVSFSSKSQQNNQDSIKLNNFVENWLGAPYRFGGTTKRGIDCSAFTQKIYQDVYEKHLPRTCDSQYHYTERVKKLNLQRGDIIFFISPASPSGWHCGIYLGDNKFVHASNKRDGVKISDLGEEFYRKHYRGAGRL